MRYITGVHALNLPCSLLTSGDWHQSGIKWDKIRYNDSENSFFGDYGIEPCETVPENDGLYYIANTIRALLDLLEQSNFAVAQGMKEDFICNDNYTKEVFKRVSMMKNLDNWNEIDRFMGKEYLCEWLNYKERTEI